MQRALQVDADQFTSPRKKQLYVAAKWRALAALLQSVEKASSAQDEVVAIADLVLRTMHSDRFSATTDAQGNMVGCIEQLTILTTGKGLSLLDVAVDDIEGDSCSYLALIKQFYVTLDDALTQVRLVAALVKLTTSKQHVKVVVRSGFLRTLLQQLPASPDIGGPMLQNAVTALVRVSSLVCFAQLPREDSANMARFLTALVVNLMLSGVSVAWQEAIRLLQMLLEHPAFASMLPSTADLRGALERVRCLLKSQPVHQRDAYLEQLCEQQMQRLNPVIDAYEKQHGSLIGLRSDSEEKITEQQALELAAQYKERGNTFFKRGNVATARVLYRRAISTLRMAQARSDQQLASLPQSELLAKCTVGASVQVLAFPSRQWANAMVSDVDEDDGGVEVLFDDERMEDAVVPIERIRLRMPTQQLDAFQSLVVDCSMNMGKALTQLHDHEHAVECFAHVLALKKQHVPALYHRGVAYMVLHDLKPAQQDLFQAHQICRKTNDPQSKKLLKQITAAYQRLQDMHSKKKKMDKKIIKQMISYLSTVPGLQGDDE